MNAQQQVTNGNEAVVVDGLMTVAAACDFLGVGRTSLYKLMDSGALRYAKIGAARRIPRAALVRLAAGALVGAGQ
jgi:excisionase family DNA binding protein